MNCSTRVVRRSYSSWEIYGIKIAEINARWTILRLRYCYIHHCTGLFTNNTGRDSSLEKPRSSFQFQKEKPQEMVAPSGCEAKEKKRAERSNETMRVIYVIFFSFLYHLAGQRETRENKSEIAILRCKSAPSRRIPYLITHFCARTISSRTTPIRFIKKIQPRTFTLLRVVVFYIYDTTFFVIECKICMKSA